MRIMNQADRIREFVLDSYRSNSKAFDEAMTAVQSLFPQNIVAGITKRMNVANVAKDNIYRF